MDQETIDKQKKRLSFLRAIALSDKDVLKLVENKARILTYSELSKYDTLDDALGEHQAIFLLYESQPDYGHWTCLFRNDDYVEFFDSYGIFPDNELEWIPKHFREISGQMYPQLTALLYYSPYKLEYNEHKFQKQEDGINTCGRWSALRLVFRDVSLKQFAEMFKGNEKGNFLSPDDVVSILTSYDLAY